MTLLIAIGILALMFGFLFLFFPQAITKMAEWSNRMITKTDDLISVRKKPVGVFLILAGFFIIGMVVLR